MSLALQSLVEPDGRALGRIAELINAGDLAVHVQDVLPLADVAKAPHLDETNRTRGKLVLRLGP